MKAIVYISKTGFTKNYAKLLSENIGLPAYTLEEAKVKLNKNDAIIYMGWICAGKISGLTEANNMFDIKCVCCVGMTNPKLMDMKTLSEKNSVNEDVLFYLQGGINREKLSKTYLFLIKMAIKLSNFFAKEKDPAVNEYMDYIENGADFVREINLKDVIVWYHSNRILLMDS